MPSTSRAQQKAMFAAAAGKSTLGIPQKVGEEFSRADTIGGMTGLPAKKTHRGARSGPGSSHLNALIKAHASGDYAGAKTHAFNLGNAIHKHLQGQADPVAQSPGVPRGTMPAPSLDQPGSPAAGPNFESPPSIGGASFLARALMNKR
jgi:hypothetical protein